MSLLGFRAVGWLHKAINDSVDNHNVGGSACSLCTPSSRTWGLATSYHPSSERLRVVKWKTNKRDDGVRHPQPAAPCVFCQLAGYSTVQTANRRQAFSADLRPSGPVLLWKRTLCSRCVLRKIEAGKPHHRKNTDHGVAATIAVKTVMAVHSRRSVLQSSTMPGQGWRRGTRHVWTLAFYEILSRVIPLLYTKKSPANLWSSLG